MKDGPEESPRHQYAALPFRDDGALEVMLVSSRETRRWVLPKGWPMKGRKPHGTAAREALEEAGLVGRIGKDPVGVYHYMKRRRNGSNTLCMVTVFPMRVQRQRKSWLEKDQRVTRWFPVEEAAELVHEPELREVILSFEALAREHPEVLPKADATARVAIDARPLP
jgi:8-oxo-dGTP pyrophosphatase MutT (NUDIX family)